MAKASVVQNEIKINPSSFYEVKEYCKECGTRLEIMPLEPASSFFGGGDNYDRATGKKRMIRWVACPKRFSLSTKIFGGRWRHTSHSVGDVILV